MAAANAFPFPAQSTAGAPTFKPWQHTVLDLLARGASIVEATRHVGYTAYAFYKACDRDKEFKVRANRARETFRASTAEEFHASETYARVLVDAVARDEKLPANLRLRAALAILNRKGDHWLPSPILHPQDTAKNLDNLDNLDLPISLDDMDIMDNPDRLATETASAFAPQAPPNESTAPSSEAPANPVETVDTLDKTHDSPTEEDEEDEIDPDLIHCFGSREMAASFMELLRESALRTQADPEAPPMPSTVDAS